MQIKTVALDDDVCEKIEKFRRYMSDDRVQMSFSRTVNFLCDLALKDYQKDDCLNGGEKK